MAQLNENLSLDAVFFDCDGILVNTEPLHYRAFLTALAPYHITFPYTTYVERYIGFDDRDAFVALARDYGVSLGPDELEQLVTTKSEAVLKEARKGVESFPGVVPFVTTIARVGVPLGVVSGSLREEVTTFLEILALRDRFVVMVTAEDVERSKPDPESYEKACARMAEHLRKKVEPGRCVVFEDTPAGINAAKGAGLRVIGVAHSLGTHELADADWVIPSFQGFTVSALRQLMR